jgi:hypothetical protein
LAAKRFFEVSDFGLKVHAKHKFSSQNRSLQKKTIQSTPFERSEE